MDTIALPVEKETSFVASAVKAVVITITFAALYWGLCMLNPAVAKSSLIAGVFGKGFRLANLLRAFVLWNPFTAIGMTLGAQAFDMSVGRPLAWIPIDGYVQVALGFGTYYVSRWIGRSTLKDIAILTVYAILGSFVSAMNSAAIGVFIFAGTGTFGTMFKGIVVFKVVTRTALVLLGYPLLLIFEGWRDKREAGSSTK